MVTGKVITGEQLLKEVVPCRGEETATLLGLLGESPQNEPASSIFVHGDTGTGKTLLVTQCLQQNAFKFSITNCVETYSLHLVYQSIIDQLSGHKMTAANNYQPYAKCINLLEFVMELQKFSELTGCGSRHFQSQSIVIVLDKCERLRALGRTVLPGLLKLGELSQLKVCVVLISGLPWSCFHVADNTADPVTVFLPQYTQKQVLTILQKNKPAGFSDKFYENYLNLFLSIFYQACRDVRELKHQAAINFVGYSEPITQGELSESDANTLWKRSQPLFKKSLHSLYLKANSGLDVTEKLTSIATQALSVELSFYSKYLLIGAYIASFNPAASDKRLFMKYHGSAKKSTKPKIPASKLHLLGPKSFGLQRLFAIVSVILDDNRFNLNADLFVEVASLVRLNLLTQMSEDVLDAPTFKCNVGLPFIDVIAKNVQFPIRNYLVDFMEG